MQKWLIFFVSLNVYAYSAEQDKIVLDVIRDARAHNYSDEEIKWAIRSNVFQVPDLVICTYLPNLGDCDGS